MQVDEYIAALDGPNRDLLERMSESVKGLVPGVQQGVSYAMPAFIYRGRPLLSLIVRKKHLGLYPFSGKVIDALKNSLARFETTSGSIHFSSENPIGGALLKQIVTARMAEIDSTIAAASRGGRSR